MKNESLQIAVNHLRLSKDELKKCTQQISEQLEHLIQVHPGLTNDLITILSALQLQDIITQRLDKIEAFLKLLDEKVNMNENREYLDEFAWENEVNQDDIDAMFN